MRLAQSANGSDLGNCCETVTQFISQSRSCFGTMRGHETGAGNLAGGKCFVSNDALDGNLARSAGRVVDTIGRSAIPAPSMGRRCGRFLSETGGVYERKKKSHAGRNSVNQGLCGRLRDFRAELRRWFPSRKFARRSARRRVVSRTPIPIGRS